jgi:hypothetical protein
LEGGDKLKNPASDSVRGYIRSIEDLSREEGLFAAFDLKNDFSNEWYSATHPPAGATERVLTLEKLNEKLPIFTKGHTKEQIKARELYLFAAGVPGAPELTLSAGAIIATQGGAAIQFRDSDKVGTMKSFVGRNVDAAMDKLEIRIPLATPAIDKMWLLERYILT